MILGREFEWLGRDKFEHISIGPFTLSLYFWGDLERTRELVSFIEIRQWHHRNIENHYDILSKIIEFSGRQHLGGSCSGNRLNRKYLFLTELFSVCGANICTNGQCIGFANYEFLIERIGKSIPLL